MEAIVLAGGFGTRLREVVPDLPKPMAPIAGRPFLEILLHGLSSKGFERVILSLGFMADSISAHFGDHYAGMKLVNVVESRPLGTGGGVRLAMDCVESDHVYVFNGDTYLDLEVAQVESLWQTMLTPIIVVRSVQDTARYGRLVIEAGRVRGFTEKGVAGPGLINAGCYVFARTQLDTLASGDVFSLEKEVLVPLAHSGSLAAFVTNGQFIDIGVPEDYFLAQSLLAYRHSSSC
jgi:D-glycero-alpha-D-manno-heptose 1-phosphate guanylyltransferase